MFIRHCADIISCCCTTALSSKHGLGNASHPPFHSHNYKSGTVEVWLGSDSDKFNFYISFIISWRSAPATH